MVLGLVATRYSRAGRVGPALALFLLAQALGGCGKSVRSDAAAGEASGGSGNEPSSGGASPGLAGAGGVSPSGGSAGSAANAGAMTRGGAAGTGGSGEGARAGNGAAGEGDGGAAGDEGDPPCEDGAVRCLAAVGVRERCVSGAWDAQDFVCAVSVLVGNDSGVPCAVKADGRFECWLGTFAFPGEKPVPPARVRAVHGRFAADWSGTLFHLEDRRLWTSGSVNPPQVRASVVSFDHDYQRGLCYATEDGGVVCENPDVLARLPLSQGVRYRQVVLSDVDACVLSDSGEAACGTASLPGRYQTLAIGIREACGLTTDGALECAGFWDRDPSFELPAGRFSALTMTDETVCALRENGDIACSRGLEVPDPPPGSYTSIDGADRTFCAIHVDGSVHCFGSPGERHEIPEGW